LLQRFKLKALPVVVAEIIAGIFVGKSGQRPQEVLLI
jgi:Kef-type K+ transport system membrane component KefB